MAEEHLDQMTIFALSTMSANAPRPLSEESIRDIAKFTEMTPDELIDLFAEDRQRVLSPNGTPSMTSHHEPFDPEYKKR